MSIAATSAPLARTGETIFVTGATGYVGSALTAALLRAGYTVRALTRSQSKVQELQDHGAEPILGDVRDRELMTKATQGVRAVVHTASPNAPAPGQSMQEMVDDAVGVAKHLADEAARHAARLVVTGGTGIYGHTAGSTVDEEGPLQFPPAAAPLAEMETTLAREGRASILRLGVVYGREQSPLMRGFVDAIRARGRPAIVSPEHRLSLVDVDDAADLYLRLLESRDPPPVVNAIGCVLPWPEVIAAVASAAGVMGEPDIVAPSEAAAFGGPAMFMPIDMAVSGDLARRSLGWQPKTPDLARSLSEAAR